MRTGPDLQLNRISLFWLTFATLVCLIVGKAVVLGAGMHENFANMGNDDIMRLTVVRDLIAGQSWFDTTQYRMVPPEGLSLHWSRYIDAGIAAIIVPLSRFIEMDLAEQIAATVWPTLIFLLLLTSVGFGTRKVFGEAAASFAMLCLVIWPLTGDVHVGPGNLDHHNVQLLTMVVLTFAVIWQQGAARAGLVAGIAAAFSFAVGLENIFFIVVAGLVLVVRAVFGAGQPRLIAFCGALFLGCCLFWLGQSPPATRFLPVCDQLSTPLISLIGVACAGSLLPLLIIGRSSRPAVILGATVLLVGVGILLILPLLGPCSVGPYGALPDLLQSSIATRIVEALPVLVYAKTNAVAAIIFLVPIFAAVLLGSILWFNGRKKPEVQEHAALGVLLVFCVCGLGLVFYQMRTVIMAATVVPMIGGVVMAQMSASYLKHRDAMRGLLMIAGVTVFIGPTVLALVLLPFLPQSGGSSGENCRTYASLQSLNDVTPGLILSHGNFGAPIIWATHHDALSAPYHRSAKALGNGIFPFAMEEPEMKTYILATGASHLLLCRDATLEGTFATSLAAGVQVDWLVPIALDDAAQMLFAVQRQ